MFFYRFNSKTGEFCQRECSIQKNGQKWLSLIMKNEHNYNVVCDIRKDELNYVNAPSCTMARSSDDYILITEQDNLSYAVTRLREYIQLEANTLLNSVKILNQQLQENTRIKYLYRDSQNFKEYYETVIPGKITKKDIDTIISCLKDGEYFIPNQIGLPGEPGIENYPLSSYDSCYFELSKDSFSFTQLQPEIDITIPQLITNFLNAKNNWEEYEFEEEEEEEEEENDNLQKPIPFPN